MSLLGKGNLNYNNTDFTKSLKLPISNNQLGYPVSQQATNDFNNTGLQSLYNIDNQGNELGSFMSDPGTAGIDDGGWGMSDESGGGLGNFGNAAEALAIREPATNTGFNFGFGGMMDLAKTGTGLMNAYTGYKQLGLAEDAFEFNKMDRNRAYGANKTKYNNALARTNAVQSHYGLGAVAKNL